MTDLNAEGLAWWNGLTEEQRSAWLRKPYTKTPAAAWHDFKSYEEEGIPAWVISSPHVERVARFLCEENGHDPEYWEPGTLASGMWVPVEHLAIRKGEEHHMLWREYVDRAERIIALLEGITEADVHAAQSLFETLP